MNIVIAPSRLVSRAAMFGLCVAAFIGAVPVAYAANANAVMTLTPSPLVPDPTPADPNRKVPRASLSRDLGAASAADFRAAYTVSITNPTNSSKNFRFVGNVTVEPDATVSPPISTPPTQFVSSRADCTLSSSNPVQIVCPKLEVAKGATIRFTFEFRTPTVGSLMTLGANVYFPASGGTLIKSDTSSIELVKLLYVQYILGFNTYVPASTVPQTYFSGVSGNLSAPSPGGVATFDDPFTTTVVIPPIGFSTSALVQELQKGELSGCTATAYLPGGCFESNITIPSADEALKGMQIYLRIDKSKTYGDANINTAVIRYFDKYGAEFSPVPSCSATVVASSGKPCIRNRKKYEVAGVPEEWQLDWEFLIEAVDNGRYLN